MSEITNKQQAIFLQNTAPDEHSFGVYKMLEDVYPAFAKKLFDGNKLMRQLIMSGHNPMDILDYPICGKCETIAAYNGYGVKYGKRVDRCTCVRDKCGASTLAPITLRQWVREEMKKRVTEDFYQAIDYAVDAIAAQMALKQIKDANRLLMKETDAMENELFGKPKIRHLGNNKPDEQKN